MLVDLEENQRTVKILKEKLQSLGDSLWHT